MEKKIPFKWGFPCVEAIKSIDYRKIKNYKTHIDSNQLTRTLNGGFINKMYEYNERNKPEKELQMREAISAGSPVVFRNLRVQTKIETTLSIRIDNNNILSWSSNDICPYTLPFSFMYNESIYFDNEEQTSRYKVILDYELGLIRRANKLRCFYNIFFNLEKQQKILNDTKTILHLKNFIGWDYGITPDVDIECYRASEKNELLFENFVKSHKKFMEKDPKKVFSEESKKQFIDSNKKSAPPIPKLDAKTWFDLESEPVEYKIPCLTMNLPIKIFGPGTIIGDIEFL